MRRDPHQVGVERARWRLEDILRVCTWLTLRTTGGLSQLLRRVGISYKRGRSHVHSPDPDYAAKLLEVRRCLSEALSAPDRVVLLFEDECSYSRPPSLDRAYAKRGHDQAEAEWGYRWRAGGRIAAALNALTGQVTYRQATTLSVTELNAFYQQVADAYPQAETIYLVQDNWPVHLHPAVLARLREQTWPWAVKTPPNWPSEPHVPVAQRRLPIRLVWLPTYASWTNPIEKLWRWLRQSELHLHHFADDWSGLRSQVTRWLEQFANGSAALLRYVGLADPERLYHAIVAQGGT